MAPNTLMENDLIDLSEVLQDHEKYATRKALNSTPDTSINDEFSDESYSDDGIVIEDRMRLDKKKDIDRVVDSFQGSTREMKSLKSKHCVEVTNDNCIKAINCVVQNYAWGRVGSSSLVARLKKGASSSFQISTDSPYAELWIGTHQKGMAILENSNESLLEYVQSNPTRHLGDAKSLDLTYLLKVLSIKKVLSIQAHPNKKLAEQLHKNRPDVYKDSNHKPEMCVALTDDFEAMCGFLPISELSSHLENYPEFAALIPERTRKAVFVAGSQNKNNASNVPETREVLKALFRAYLEAPEDKMSFYLECLIKRLSTKEHLNDVDRLMLKFSEQFHGDCGIFSPLLLNYMKLTKGESFFIGPDEPHAYIQGEIVECMACSDNVVRSGLTPKLKDVPTLVSMLTYDTRKPITTRGKQIDQYTRMYLPPVDDFAIEFVELPPNTEYKMRNVQSGSVLLTLTGNAKILQGKSCIANVDFGSCSFMSANTLATVKSGAEGLHIVRAMSNSTAFSDI
mmetsp:Transcript_59940/g.70033  ORF Transcript_59940/g.70033 Transcript_59940/m.70033 type:complete len:510 (+) Transcript_59940:60-1589(+)